ncbi:phenylacetate--CoA ligase family protein [Alicyclobacillus shizuokensis]|uniref:phenylacetate--CoA ligase family protein n=1 Tax=Alicyclobacillus shizuokensis TaxID=392014 RepID=UPI001FDEDD43|nr:AMP-binding protein [Alicyclobacillus shizuokensis]
MKALSLDADAHLRPPYGSGVEVLRGHQFAELNRVLMEAREHNPFYQEKLAGVKLPLQRWEDLAQVPFTTKAELVDDQQRFPPFGRNHYLPEHEYVQYHQTSGTKGKPLKVLDTPESWAWWRDCWVEVLQTAGVTREDRVFLAFSFGPFIGFWAAYAAAEAIGALVIPGGGQTSLERLRLILEMRATVLLCTPSYALHLAEVAAENGLDLKSSAVRVLIHAGEPGASIPSVRDQIDTLWNARCYDHSGMTEMGAYAYACQLRRGLHVNERQFFAEIIDPVSGDAVPPGQTGELVLTNFGRRGYPLIRYRTGDIVVAADQPCPCGRPFRFLPGGVVGRSDDMVVIRGVNIFPQSIEAIVREFSDVREFRIVYYTEEQMPQIKVQVEADTQTVGILGRRLREGIGLRIDVEPVEPGSLPRFEMKARRVLDLRPQTQVAASGPLAPQDGTD